MNAFEEKRQAKIERLESRAASKQSEASQAWDTAHKMADVIPFGQPILVGHHSEQADRRYRGRIDNKYFQAVHLEAEARSLEQRAEAARNNTAIFSDDPNATEKLEDKLQRLEKRQSMMVQANKLLRKKDIQGLLDMGFTESNVKKMQEPGFMGTIGFAKWELSNNNAVIRNVKLRIEQLNKKNTQHTSEIELNGVRIVDNVEDNRLQLFFDGKPSESTRSELKHAGYRWTPSVGCWQAYRKQWALEQAKTIINKI
jgi:hypothetical protein